MIGQNAHARLSEPSAAAIAIALRRFRSARRLTLKQVADLSGLCISAISQLETGKTTATVSVAKLQVLLAAYDVTLCGFFSRSLPQ